MSSPVWRASFAAFARRSRHPSLPHTRRLSTAPPSRSSRYLQTTKAVVKWTGFVCLSTVVGVVVVGAGILVHDMFTYTDKHIDRVPVNPLALNPQRGGPKNLPVAKILVDDEEDEEAKKLASKPRLVIIGAGWGVRLLPISRAYRAYTCPVRPWASSIPSILAIITSLSSLPRRTLSSHLFFLVGTIVHHLPLD